MTYIYAYEVILHTTKLDYISYIQLSLLLPIPVPAATAATAAAAAAAAAVQCIVC